MSNFVRVMVLVAAGVALTAGAAHRAIAQQSAFPKVKPKDFVDKLEAVRHGIERERNERPAPSNGNARAQLVVDVCKRNPQLPQCKLN